MPSGYSTRSSSTVDNESTISQGRTRNTRRARGGSQARVKSLAGRSRARKRSGTSNSGGSKTKSVRIQEPGDTDTAAENAYLRAQIAALQKEVDIHVARETARLQQQREETARRKQELKAQRKAMMEQRGLDFEPDSSRTSEISILERMLK